MPKYSLVILWVSLVIASLAILLAVTTVSPSYQECVRQQHSTRNDGVFDSRAGTIVICEATFANENGAAITGIATVLLAVVTALLVYLAWGQGRTTRAQLRAYLLVEATNISAPYGRTTISVKIKNFGQTPAQNVRAGITIGVQPMLLTSLPPFTFDGVANRTLGPGDFLYLEASLDNPLSAEQRREIEANRMAIFAIGKIEYADVFGRVQTTEFCLYHNRDAGNAGLGVHPIGNIAT